VASTSRRPVSLAERFRIAELAGDVLIEFDGKKIDNLYDFTYALRAHKPGDKASVDSPARNRKNNP
jgi:S1-C subfamily serine protease